MSLDLLVAHQESHEVVLLTVYSRRVVLREVSVEVVELVAFDSPHLVTYVLHLSQPVYLLLQDLQGLLSEVLAEHPYRFLLLRLLITYALLIITFFFKIGSLVQAIARVRSLSVGGLERQIELRLPRNQTIPPLSQNFTQLFHIVD
jgi:hypothetical protein